MAQRILLQLWPEEIGQTQALGTASAIGQQQQTTTSCKVPFQICHCNTPSIRKHWPLPCHGAFKQGQGAVRCLSGQWQEPMFCEIFPLKCGMLPRDGHFLPQGSGLQLLLQQNETKIKGERSEQLSLIARLRVGCVAVMDSCSTSYVCYGC